METEKKRIIDEIVNKYIACVYVTPALVRSYIPAENILPMKEELSRCLNIDKKKI